MDTHFDQMPSPPSEATAGAILATMIHAAGFRYRWATADLPAESLGFRPAPTSMTLGELLHHLQRLASWLESTFAASTPHPAPLPDLDATRQATLASLAAAASSASSMSVEDLTVLRIQRGSTGDSAAIWNVLHGPLADFLTHVGQVASWRRILGSPAPAARVFDGLGPAESAPHPSSGAPLASAPVPTFVDEDLAGATFRDVALTGSSFDDVSLAGARFTNVTLAGATLQDVDLSNVHISGANLEGLRIDGKLLSGEA